MVERAVDSIENLIEVKGDVLGQEAQDEISVLLKQGVLSTIAAIGFGIGEVLGAVELEDEVEIFVEEIDLHATGIPERDRKAGIEFKTALCLRQSLEPTEQKGL